MEWTAGLEDNLPHVQSPVRPTPIRTGGAMSPVRPHHQVEPQLASPTGTFERTMGLVFRPYKSAPNLVYYMPQDFLP